MIAIADKSALYFLEFTERKNLATNIKRFEREMNATIVPGRNPIIDSIQNELTEYFTGTLTNFTTPITLLGTPFQKTVWEALRQIPYGQTNAYATLAKTIQKPQGYRAVARANSTNKLALIVPCHRVINADGKLGGYAGGINRKAWLLEHERSSKQ